jgi:sialidase-1
MIVCHLSMREESSAGRPTRRSSGASEALDAGDRARAIIPGMDGWEALGGRLGSAPAVTSWAENEMQVFAIWDDGQLYDIYWDGAAWHEWHAHGGELTGSPAACSWGPDRIDVFARGRDGALWHLWYEPDGWQPWERLPVSLASDPAACSWGPNRIDVFARDAGGDLVHAAWTDGAWSFGR